MPYILFLSLLVVGKLMDELDWKEIGYAVGIALAGLLFFAGFDFSPFYFLVWMTLLDVFLLFKLGLTHLQAR